MRLEFYAFVFFLFSVVTLSFLISERKPVTMEEVLLSPSLFLKNPYKYLILKKTNEINQQLFFLEYKRRIKVYDDSKTLEQAIFSVQDRRATMYITKKVWHYWWGYGVEWIKYKIKHIDLLWYPRIYLSEGPYFPDKTFGDALWKALNGINTSFRLGKSDKEIARLIAEKYNVEFVDATQIPVH